MAAEKYSASMDSELLQEVRAVAAKQGLTISAWLARAADHQMRLEGLRELVVEWEAEHGAITSEELETVERKLAVARLRAAKRAAARGETARTVTTSSPRRPVPTASDVPPVPTGTAGVPSKRASAAARKAPSSPVSRRSAAT